MLAHILAVPFMLGGLYFLYLTWEVGDMYAKYIVACVLPLTAIYVMSPQINWWYYKRRPPLLDLKLVKLFQNHFPFYNSLSLEGKKKFHDRVVLFVMAHDFIAKGMESVGEDIKGVIAANAVWLGFNQEDFLYPKFERIVVYPHPFPTPAYKTWHSSEMYEEDGVLLFAVEQMMNSFLHPKKYFNIVLYEYVKVFRLTYPDYKYPTLPENIWEKLEKISGWKKSFIEAWVGLEALDVDAVSVVIFMTFKERFKEELPEFYQSYVQIYGILPNEKIQQVN